MQVPHPNEVVRVHLAGYKANSHFSKLSVIEKGNPAAQIEESSACKCSFFFSFFSFTSFFSRLFSSQ